MTGLHSKSLPRHLLETYRETLACTDPFKLVEAVAIQNALINQHLSEMGHMPPMEIVRAVRGQIDAMMNMVMAECDDIPAELEDIAFETRQMLKSIDTARTAELEVRRLMQEKAKMVVADAQRVERSKKYLTVEQAAAMVAAIITLVNKHVNSEAERSALADELIGLIDRENSTRTEDGSAARVSAQELP